MAVAAQNFHQVPDAMSFKNCRLKSTQPDLWSEQTGEASSTQAKCGRGPCERLIIESTFGMPIYRFLCREDACERITSFARESLAEGIKPVFEIAYFISR